MSTAIQTAAALLIAKGYAVHPIKPREKRPTASKWSTRSASTDEFADGDNICILTGWLSDNLVCVDLDAINAVALADQYLPPTPMMDGRPGKPNSHRYYRVTGIPPDYTGPADPNCASARESVVLGKHPGPRKVAFRDDAGKVIVEMLGSGQQAVCPPSIHHSGEVRTWADDTMPPPAVIPFMELLTAVQSLAAACGWQPAERVTHTPPPTPVPVGRCEQPDDDGLDVPPQVREQRCRDYLDSIPDADLSRSGRGGHDECRRIAGIVVNDFAISDSDTALSLLRRYNERLRPLNDAWSEDELRHKLDAALSAPHGAGYGCKLAPLAPPMAWDNPKRLADAFLRGHTVRCLHSTPFLYADGHYRPLGKDEFTGTMRRFIEQQADAEHARLSLKWDAAETLATRMTPNELKAHQKGKPVVVQKVGRELVAATEQSLRAATQLPGTTLPGSWLTNPRDGSHLAVANGLLELRTGQLHPHTPDYFTLTALPVKHDPAAPCEWWEAFINDTTQGDTSKAAVLQEVAGACLDAHSPHKFFAMLTGGGDNGKSVFLNVLRFTLGAGNCAAVPLDDLTGNRFAAYGLFGKLANLVGDQGRFDSADEGRLKQLTGGDLFKFEQKGRDAINAPNTAKLVFACNSPPTLSDKSDAVWNRVQMVPFTWTVPTKRKNPAMLTEDHWQAELPGILNWMLEGLCRLHTVGGFTESAACQAAKRQHRSDSNPAREFLLGRCGYTSDVKDRVSMTLLYNEYLVFCSDDGIKHPLRKKAFNDEVKRAFPAIGDPRTAKLSGQSVRCWCGLRDLTAGETVPAGGLQSYETVTEPAPVL